MGVPPKFLSWKLKIWPKINRFKVNNFRVSGSNLTGLLSVDAPWGRGDNLGTIFTTRPQKFVTSKNVQNSARFLTTFDFYREYLRNRSSFRQSEKTIINYSTTPSTLGRKNLVNVGPQTKKLLTLINVHPYGLFRETTFWPLCGAAPSNFYTR